MSESTKKGIKKISKKSWIIFAVLLLIFVILIPIGYALFSDRDSDQLGYRVGKVEVQLREESQWENVPETGIERTTKTVKGYAPVDTKPAYVRIKAVPVVQYRETVEPTEPGGESTTRWITVPVERSNIALIFDGGNSWVQSGEYWYYTSQLTAGQYTSDLGIRWNFLELPSEIADKQNIRADIRVVLEYAQAENDVWKSVFQINQLPF